MKIAFVTYDTPNDIGGVSTWLQRILPELQKLGIQVEAHVLAAEGKPGVNCQAFYRLNIPTRIRKWACNTKQDMRSCFEMAIAGKPDVYVPNCIIPAYYVAGHLRQMGVYTIGVLHSDDPAYWGIVDEFIGSNPQFQLSAVVAVSKFLYDTVKPKATINGVNILNIHCGIPIPEAITRPSSEVFRLVYSGRFIEEQKRISTVASAFCNISQSNPRIEGWMIGDGEQSEDVKRACSANKKANVKIIGRVTPDKVQQLMTECHAFILLSDYEGLPVALLEAMAAGVVPICLQMKSGISDVVTHAHNGFIVTDRTTDLYKTVKLLEEDPVLWGHMSANARTTIKESFSVASAAQMWVNHIKALPTTQKKFKIPWRWHLPQKNPKFGNYDQRDLFRKTRILLNQRAPKTTAFAKSIIKFALKQLHV